MKKEQHCTKCGSTQHTRENCPLKDVKIRRRLLTSPPRNPLRFVIFG